MTKRDFESELARATGESKSTLRNRGFGLVYPPDTAPMMVDWDELDSERLGIFPDYQGRKGHR